MVLHYNSNSIVGIIHTMDNIKMENIQEEIRKKQEELKSLREKSKQKMDLKETEQDNLLVGIRKDGKTYSVRKHRDRFFYPKEWFTFFDSLRETQKMVFDILINTGARINEAINIKASDIDFERNTLLLRVTKVKAKKGEKFPRPRLISLSSQFTRRLRKYCKDKNLVDEKGNIIKDGSLNLLSKPASHTALKSALKRIGIKDYYNFSLHNIRKTHGNYLKALQICSDTEICRRLGHDMNTLLKSYVSPDIFNYRDKEDMKLILGDLYRK